MRLVGGAVLALALAMGCAAGCKEEKAAGPKTVPLAESKEATQAKKNIDGELAAEMPEEPEVPDAGADEERRLPPGMVWLPVAAFGVDVAAAPEARIEARGKEIRLTHGAQELRMRRAAGEDMAAVKARLTKQATKINWIVDRAEGDEFRLEYVMMDRKSKKPVFGLAMRRVIGARRIDCTSQGAETTSNAMAFEACLSMRATPDDVGH